MNAENINQILQGGTLIFFLVLILVFIILSIILNHHWVRYGIMQKNIKGIQLLYFGVSAILLSVMAVILFLI